MISLTYKLFSHIDREIHIRVIFIMFSGGDWAIWSLVGIALVLAYLVRVNQQLSGTPEEVKRLSGSRWTPELLKKTYERLQQHPIEYTQKLPPKLDRRYVVTGGSGELSFFVASPLPSCRSISE